MTAELIGWQDEDLLDHRRRMRNAMLVSLAIHGVVVALFAASPGSQQVLLPEVLAVELVAALPSAAPRARPAPPKAAEPAPAPPTPEPPPEPAPPVAKAPVQVLPEQAPGRIRKVKPEPKPVVRRPMRERELSLEEAMAALDDELGVDETAALLKPVAEPTDDDDSNAQAPADDRRARPGVEISPELAAWNLATQRLIQSKWVTPSSYRGRGLATSLQLDVAASGALVGRPTIYRSSGDPFFDDTAIRALLTVAPLPPVAEPGPRIFIFRSEEN